ncbi:MAG: exodeoxyribonuclease VII large subunit [Flavobacteriales bacterium]
MAATPATYTLRQLASAIQRTLQAKANQSYWIRAEMHSFGKSSSSEHAYPELIEYANNEIVARMKGVIWKTDLVRIQDNFLRTVGEPIRGQLKVLVLGTVEYHPVYGLSLRITDLDPTFTLGELQQKKREVLDRLEKEGLLQRNKQLPVGRWFKRIAVITADSSDGWRDFTNVLSRHALGHRIQTMLFESIMQGDSAPRSLMAQLRRIQSVQEHFDAVVILRGGGGDISLLCYDDEQLAREMAQFPLPIITGIGHSTNLTVAECVAHHHCITPTDLAHFFLEKLETDEQALWELIQSFQKNSRQIMMEHGHLIQGCSARLMHAAKQEITRLKNDWQKTSTAVPHLVRSELQHQHQMLQMRQVDIKQCAGQIIQHRQIELHQVKSELKNHSEAQVQQAKALHQTKQSEIMMRWNLELQKHNLRLDGMQTAVTLLDPKNTLKRGYSISRFEGKSITNPDALPVGSIIETTTYQGVFKSSKME